MKKLLIIALSTITMVACSRDDNGDNKNGAINPPSWIQGDWVSENTTGYTFTKDNFCLSVGPSKVCYKGDAHKVINQESTADTYKVTFQLVGASQVTNEFEFKKISDTQIKDIKNNSLYTRK